MPALGPTAAAAAARHLRQRFRASAVSWPGEREHRARAGSLAASMGALPSCHRDGAEGRKKVAACVSRIAFSRERWVGLRTHGACARQQFVGHPCGRATMSWLNVSRERETSEREHDLTFRNRPGSTPAKLRAACLTAKAMDGDRAGTRAAVRRVRPLDRYTGACARPPNPAPP